MVAMGDSLCSQWLHNTGNEEGGRDRNSGSFLEAKPYCPSIPTLGFLPGFRLWPVQEDGTVDPDVVHQEVSSAGHPQLHPP